MEVLQELPALTTQLSQLPEVIAANASLADRAVATVRAQLATLTPGDITVVPVEQMEQNDVTLAALQTRLKEAYTLMNDRRKPYTQRMDEVKALLTAEEKKVVEIGNEVKALRDSWQREKARRNSIEQEKQAKELEKKQALIDAKTYIAKCIIDKFSTHAVGAIRRMHEKFYAQGVAQLEAYAETLGKWSPRLDAQAWMGFREGVINPRPQLLTTEECNVLLREVCDDQQPKLEKEWIESMTRERDGLIEMVPSRKMELERIAGDAEAKRLADERIAQEAAEREAQAKRDAEDKAQALDQAASVDSLNASFDVAAQSTPVVGMAKGTQIRKKYVATTHAAWLAIIQQWVSQDMNKVTIEELGKKFSFMKTAAEKRLNEGVVLEAKGLEVTEDYSTRSSKKTA